jgi:hypothetical protein
MLELYRSIQALAWTRTTLSDSSLWKALSSRFGIGRV